MFKETKASQLAGNILNKTVAVVAIRYLRYCRKTIPRSDWILKLKAFPLYELKFSLTNQVMVVKGQDPWLSYDLDLAEGVVTS